MEVAAFKIARKTRQLALGYASIKDFQLLEAELIAPDTLCDSPCISLYSLDFETQRAVFVETPTGLTLSDASFYWMVQYQQAVRVITLPFTDFVLLASQISSQISMNPNNLTFIYSVGRAGSTLAAKIFSCVSGTEAISEPDALTAIVRARYFALVGEQGDDLTTKHLLDASVRFLCKSTTATKFIIKGRSQVVEIGDWLHELYPQAKKIFLYRNAESWLISAKSAFTDGEKREAKSQIVLEQNIRTYLEPVTQLVAAYRDDQHLSMIELLALTWLSAMDACLRMCNMDIEILPIRFVSWQSHPEETARRLLAYCGCYPVSSERLLDVLSRDSQANTVLSQKNIRRREQRLLPGDVEKLYYHLSRHSTIRSADFNMPGTLQHAKSEPFSQGETP